MNEVEWQAQLEALRSPAAFNAWQHDLAAHQQAQVQGLAQLSALQRSLLSGELQGLGNFPLRYPAGYPQYPSDDKKARLVERYAVDNYPRWRLVFLPLFAAAQTLWVYAGFSLWSRWAEIRMAVGL